jgi:hypothetical protein
VFLAYDESFPHHVRVRDAGKQLGYEWLLSAHQMLHLDVSGGRGGKGGRGEDGQNGGRGRTATTQLGAAMQSQVLLHDHSALTNLYQNGESGASGGR